LCRTNRGLQGRHGHFQVENPQHPLIGRVGVTCGGRAGRLVLNHGQMAKHLQVVADPLQALLFENRGSFHLSPGMTAVAGHRGETDLTPDLVPLGRHHDRALLVVHSDRSDLRPFGQPVDGRLHLRFAVQEHPVVGGPHDQPAGSVQVGSNERQKVLFRGIETDHGVNGENHPHRQKQRNQKTKPQRLNNRMKAVAHHRLLQSSKSAAEVICIVTECR
jgi:hypothetical protein